MENKYTRVLEKSVVDLLQYSPLGIEDAVAITFETILKAEQSEFLGYDWGDKPDCTQNKRNGYRSSLVQGINRVFRVKVPRDRLGNFKPVFLELLKEESEELNNLAFKLYSKGLTTRDIEDIFQDLYESRFSKSSISRITSEFTEERKRWQARLLDSDYYVIFIDALWLPVRRGNVEKEAFYVAFGLKPDLTRDVLSVWCLPEETASGWEELLKDLKERGVKHVISFVADGLTGLERAIDKVYPRSQLQSCLIHKERNVMNKVRAYDKKEVVSDFKNVFELEDETFTMKEGKRRLEGFLCKWSDKYPSLKNLFPVYEIDKYFTYLNFPRQMRRMVYTTNWLESLNNRIKRTTKIRCSFPNEDSALNLVCAMIMDICQRNYYRYKVTSLILVKDKLDEMLVKIKLKT